MLSKILTIVALFTPLVSHAEKSISLYPEYARITEPFTSSATAVIDIKNNTQSDIKIIKVESDNARHVNFYENKLSDIGAKQKKRVKSISIKAKKTTEFGLTSDFQIIFTGLTRKYTVGEELDLKIKLEDGSVFKTKLPVHSYYN